MNIAFYSGASGMLAFQQDMDLIANNIANVNTTGYKSQRSVFSDLLYSRMAVNTEENFLVGHGVKVADADLVFRQGPVLTTNNSLDFAIIGAGFFAVQHEGGEIEYTRNGAFDIGMDGTTGYLITSDGAYVLDEDGDPIELTRKADGTFDLEEVAGQLGVYQFPNPFGLEPTNYSRFIPTERSGEAVLSADADNEKAYRVVSQALEASAVDLSDEMVMVIQTQKAFQFSARLVQTADQLEEIVNNLR